jgi:guanosine-3',5'-bis(diphosphate) 3'-pyrophosphohydrolase
MTVPAPPGDPAALLFDAIAFAARAHRHQVRKDGLTPYVSHVFRVAMVVRQVFSVDDPNVLTAAVLHDTIEDTPTDFDEIAERFGGEVAGWVAALTKDMRLPEPEREAVYRRRLAAAGWQVAVCKLADVYDNLADSAALGPGHRRRTVERSRAYLDTLRPAAHPEAAAALAVVADRLATVERGLPPEKVG